MDYEIIDNFLSHENYSTIKNYILEPHFSWNLSPVVSNLEDDLSMTSSYYFTHEFWCGFYHEPEVQIFSPILNEIECRSIIRIKGNLYPSTEKVLHHNDHIDYDFSHRGAIFYLNTNNGLTILNNEVEVNSIENRLLLFDPSKIHRSTTCSDDKCRINVNFNFF
jgi:hypothetical protein